MTRYLHLALELNAEDEDNNTIKHIALPDAEFNSTDEIEEINRFYCLAVQLICSNDPCDFDSCEIELDNSQLWLNALGKEVQSHPCTPTAWMFRCIARIIDLLHGNFTGIFPTYFEGLLLPAVIEKNNQIARWPLSVNGIVADTYYGFKRLASIIYHRQFYENVFKPAESHVKLFLMASAYDGSLGDVDLVTYLQGNSFFLVSRQVDYQDIWINKENIMVRVKMERLKRHKKKYSPEFTVGIVDICPIVWSNYGDPIALNNNFLALKENHYNEAYKVGYDPRIKSICICYASRESHCFMYWHDPSKANVDIIMHAAHFPLQSCVQNPTLVPLSDTLNGSISTY